MLRAFQVSQDFVRNKPFLLWSLLAFTAFNTLWCHLTSACDMATSCWSTGLVLSAVAGVALALVEQRDEVDASQSTLELSIDDVPLADWLRVVPSSSPYMQPAYLRAMEKAGVEFRYALAYEEGRPVAAAAFQIVEVRLANIMQEGWRLPLRLLLSGVFWGRVRVLIAGNAFQSWTGSFVHNSDCEQEAGAMLARLTEEVSRRESQEGRIHFAILRDLELGDSGQQELAREGYTALPNAGPTMVVPLDQAWTDGADYVAAMSKKYRARVRRARKKGVALEHSELSIEQLVEQKQELAPLLAQVVDQASFKLARCSLDEVVELKRHLGEDFVVRVYRLEGAAVGFSCAMVHEERLEALLVGMDYQFNQEHCLYQNMLYDFVELGISHGCEVVHMGRTALEIKSTVGAKPVELPILVRHRRAPLNHLLRFGTRWLHEIQWTPRNPFKNKA